MSGLFAGTPLERPVTCEVCKRPLAECTCPRDASGRVLLPKDQTATIRREKRRKGKVVTTITGLDPAASDLIAILRTLKSACAAGGTVTTDDAGKAVIEIQGDHRDKVTEMLAGAGYPVRLAGG
ncbi:MAG: translation initiation factor [Phycisphaerales bacterium]|nr:MAG: translation initiation factor [Phycisphaerales bacterium]